MFDRSKWRYIIFAIVITAIVCLSLFYKSGDSLQGLVGAIIMLMIVGGYLFFLAKTNTEIEMTIKPEGLSLGNRLIPYSQLKGFVVEMEKDTGKLRNIVLVFKKNVEIFTLKDSKENQEIFFTELSKIIPYLENYEQGNLDRLMRRLKI